MYGPGRVKVACCKPCCRTKAKKKTIKKNKTKTEKRISQENRWKKINLRPPKWRFFSSPAFRSWVFFGLKLSGKTKQRNKKCELCQFCTQNVLSVYFPVPNNSSPPRLLIFRYFVGPPLSYLDPLRLLIFQILFCRYFRDC